MQETHKVTTYAHFDEAAVMGLTPSGAFRHAASLVPPGSVSAYVRNLLHTASS
jgi:hypothetical protein